MQLQQHIQIERRHNHCRRKKIAEMSEDELRQALLTDELTGLANERAYADVERMPIQAFLDLEGLKWINDHWTHQAGDAYIIAAANSLRMIAETVAGRIFRAQASGDEFIMEFASQDDARQALKMARLHLSARIWRFQDVGGCQHQRQGIGICAGVGTSLAQAQADYLRAKANLIDAGLWASRGECPYAVQIHRLIPQY